MDTILSVVNQEDQPNLNYFNTKIDWKAYVNRTPDEFENWYNSTSDEVTGFEIAELIKLSANSKVIARVNNRNYYDKYQNSGFFTVVRSNTEADTREETLEIIAKHFGLTCEDSVEVLEVEIGNAEWNKLIDYTNNCSWIAGSHLAAVFSWVKNIAESELAKK